MRKPNVSCPTTSPVVCTRGMSADFNDGGVGTGVLASALACTIASTSASTSSCELASSSARLNESCFGGGGSGRADDDERGTGERPGVGVPSFGVRGGFDKFPGDVGSLRAGISGGTGGGESSDCGISGREGS